MHKRCLAVSFITICATRPSSLRAEESSTRAQDSQQNNTTWHARLGVGVSPIIEQNTTLPDAHTGFGASISGFYQLPFRLSVGANFDWDAFTFDSANHGDLRTNRSPRYQDRGLRHTRLMGLVQWDILDRNFITPFVIAGAGYGWEHATLTEWQCSPKLASGLVLSAGLGAEVALTELFGLGVEYRISSLPSSIRSCTLAQIDDEPLGAPGDFIPQRIALTFSLRQ